ncbi:MAG: glycoside hydrolase family 11 protein [Xenococcus sp. MO_188.B8]|nr:glycoside hydrolase family 11 protein [Xenococcus sp. MO_188.B8]
MRAGLLLSISMLLPMSTWAQTGDIHQFLKPIQYIKDEVSAMVLATNKATNPAKFGVYGTFKKDVHIIPNSPFQSIKLGAVNVCANGKVSTIEIGRQEKNLQIDKLMLSQVDTSEPTLTESEKPCSFDWATLIKESEAHPLKSCQLTDPAGIISFGSGPLKMESHAWTSDTFEGNFCRQFSGDGILTTQMQITNGGFDTAIVKKIGLRVDDLAPNTTHSATINVNLEGTGGRWWTGSKIPTRPCLYSSECANFVSGWYENYVVEHSSDTPEEFHERLTRLGSYLGQTFHNGSLYKHYFKTHKNWQQFWAVRQEYRSSGSISVKPILDKWRAHGLPNDYVKTFRSNIETQGNWCGSVEIKNFNVSLD